MTGQEKLLAINEKGLPQFDFDISPQFAGREEELKEIFYCLDKYHLALICGGCGSGKTSLLRQIAYLKRRDGNDCHMLVLTQNPDLGSIPSPSTPEAPRQLVLIDEFNRLYPSTPETMLAVLGLITGLVAQKNDVVIALHGDLQYQQNGKEVPEFVRNALLAMCPTRVTIKLMPDKDIRGLWVQAAQGDLDPEILEELVQQTGGHPLMLRVLGDFLNLWSADFSVDADKLEWIFLFSKHLYPFEPSVDYVQKVGFDPFTFDHQGSKNPVAEVYKQMLPDRRATLFYAALRLYLEDR